MTRAGVDCVARPFSGLDHDRQARAGHSDSDWRLTIEDLASSRWLTMRSAMVLLRFLTVRPLQAQNADPLPLATHAAWKRTRSE